MKLTLGPAALAFPLRALGVASAIASVLVAIGVTGQSGLALAIRLAIVSIVLLVSSRLASKEIDVNRITGSRNLALLSATLTLVMLSFGMLIRFGEIQRSVLDLVILGSVWGLVLVQATWSPIRPMTCWLIVSEAAAISLFSMFSVNLAYPAFNGHRDFLVHVSIVQDVLKTGGIPGQTLYEFFPVLHVLTSEVALYTGLPGSSSLALVGGLSLVATLPFVYEIGLRFVANERAALLGVILFASSADFQIWGTYAAPTTLGFVFAFLILAQLLRRDSQLQRRVIALVLLAAVILTHILAAALLFILICLVLISDLAKKYGAIRPRTKPGISTPFAILAGVAMAAYWIFLAFGVLRNYIAFVNFAFEPFPFLLPSSSGGVGSAALRSLNIALLVSLYAIGFLAIGFMWKRRNNPTCWSILGASLVYVAALVPSIAPTPVFGEYPFALHRWTLFGIPFVAMIIGALYVCLPRRSWRLVVSLTLVIAMTFAASAAAFDLNPNLSGTQSGTPNDVFTQSELTAYAFVSQHTGGRVTTDLIYSALFLYGSPGTPGISVNYSLEGILNPHGNLVLRVSELDQRGLHFVTLRHGFEAPTVINASLAAQETQTASLIYDDGSVRMFQWS